MTRLKLENKSQTSNLIYLPKGGIRIKEIKIQKSLIQSNSSIEAKF
jgi:hypothetical protein